MTKRSMVYVVAAAVAVSVFVVACSGPKQEADVITVTFIRNGQSQAEAAGVISTDIPGPDLSNVGIEQAQRLVRRASHYNFDSVFSSARAETQQTAEPIAAQLQRRVETIDGLQPIGAGWFNGKPQTMAASTYMLAPMDWLNGDIQNRIPGSVSGTQFNDQFTGAMYKIFSTGHLRPVVFSQGTAIMLWTLMNTSNANERLLTTHPLPNIGYIVVTGSPTHGWTLVDWDGIHNFN